MEDILEEVKSFYKNLFTREIEKKREREWTSSFGRLNIIK
jgi:hypothetical protein